MFHLRVEWIQHDVEYDAANNWDDGHCLVSCIMSSRTVSCTCRVDSAILLWCARCADGAIGVGCVVICGYNSISTPYSAAVEERFDHAHALIVRESLWFLSFYCSFMTQWLWNSGCVTMACSVWYGFYRKEDDSREC